MVLRSLRKRRTQNIHFNTLLPMQHFTQDDFSPAPTTILFIKQFARMCNSKKTLTKNGYDSFTVAACC
jgi:hypothetical protein